jgi:hypothetical protein
MVSLETGSKTKWPWLSIPGIVSIASSLTPSADGGPHRKRLPKILLRLTLAILLTCGVGWALNRSVAAANQSSTPAGLGRGILHGALMPGAWPYLIVGKDLVIYAENNNGRWYKLGYTMGVNGCGALFFGAFYWRLNRWRKTYVAYTQNNRPDRRD